MARKNNTQLFLEDMYKHRNPTGHWFDADTLQFFKSEIHTELKGDDSNDIYFIESQKKCFSDESRIFSVRHMDVEGSVNKIHEGTYNECKKHIATC